MDRNNELLLRVAQMYHVQAETMHAIANQLGVSRSTVSRLLKDARDRGLVRVTVVDPERPLTRVSELFERHFHVTAHLVNVRPGASSVFRLDQVAKVAARLLDETIRNGDTVGIAWGTTTSAIAMHLRPGTSPVSPLSDSTAVPTIAARGYPTWARFSRSSPAPSTVTR